MTTFPSGEPKRTRLFQGYPLVGRLFHHRLQESPKAGGQVHLRRKLQGVVLDLLIQGQYLRIFNAVYSKLCRRYTGAFKSKNLPNSALEYLALKHWLENPTVYTIFCQVLECIFRPDDCRSMV